MKRLSVADIVIRRLIGLLIYFVLLGGFNVLAGIVQSPDLAGWVGFFNGTARLVIFFTVIFLFSDLFESFHFPFNIPYPLFNAYGSILVISFIFRIISFAVTGSQELYGRLTDIIIIISAIVAVIILVSGYIGILVRAARGDDYEDERLYWRERRVRRDERRREKGEWREERRRKNNAEENNKKSSSSKGSKKEDNHDWHDVGEEFREMLYDAFHSARGRMKKK